ncbi:Cyclic di-GMP phosphodiesterase response regulator RpfG [Sporotomaculum syntrophicum]|uniref:Cyclic di-GMP phosphodiesterase response regulator RpfG n=1 Tax=Sporotomaculum syntrophicum TaxID=182264 RepID=A0A9D2WTB5_9FIRM|nr:PAS domain S-box protein [Sporotomaculum syntrophicum]KAF1086566.1 Cyclic di-GMP phosphodiesterase response regulator RpfG [Sporotomaculum syntrophicum]
MFTPSNNPPKQLNCSTSKLKQVEEALRESEEQYRQLVELSLDAVIIYCEGKIVFANMAAVKLIGATNREEIIGKSLMDIVHPDCREIVKERIRQAQEQGKTAPLDEEKFTRLDGSVVEVEVTAIPFTFQAKPATQAIVRDITERKLAERVLRESEEKYRTIFETAGSSMVIIEGNDIISLANTEAEKLFGYSKGELEDNKNWTEFILQDDLEKIKEFRRMRRIGPNATLRNCELRFIDRQGNVKNVLMTVDVIPGTGKSVASFLDITERTRAENRISRLYRENLRQLKTLSALYDNAQKLGQSLDLQELAEDVTRTCVEIFGVSLAGLSRAEEDGSVSLPIHYPREIKYPRQATLRWDNSSSQELGPTGTAIRTGSPVIITDIASDPIFAPWRKAALEQGYCCSAAFPLISRGKPFGALVLHSDRPGFFSSDRVEFFRAYAQQVAAALINARLFKEIKRHSEHLQALRNIDMAITSSLDLRVTFNVILDQVTAQLGIDAACILLLNKYTHTLEYAAGRGFLSKAIERSRFHLGEGYAGRAVLERRIVVIPNLTEAEGFCALTRLMADEGFISYYGVPLMAKGQVNGVLEIFHRAPLDPDHEWLYFLEALAGQAAIAIDNAALFDELQRSNVELTLAYNATIEGWAHALDLRDKGTEGHSRRVTEMTMRLARALGMSDAELVHVRRGALLHDIGKMGIPDRILLKPGPLTEEEWTTMYHHPVYAYEMLSSINYLRQALDIPYCHHEKWDGTGYPRGLKGEQIPLAARIFAVVDVWDALTSERPYRSAWPEGKVREHILEQSGKHFDPRVVEVFLEMEL